jgi:hypothetical protein
MKINKKKIETQTTKKPAKSYYKFGVIFFILFIISSSVFAQEYLKIEGTKRLFRYFPNLKMTDEIINDSTNVSIKKQKTFYKIKLIIGGKKIAERLYVFNGLRISQDLLGRVLDEQGSKFVHKKISVRILTPVNNDCITRLISD